jgi:hypothetical protein
MINHANADHGTVRVTSTNGKSVTVTCAPFDLASELELELEGIRV